MSGGGMGAQGVSSTGYGQPTSSYQQANDMQQHVLPTAPQQGGIMNALGAPANPNGPPTGPIGVQGLFGNIPPTNQQPVFNAQYYLQQNPDVAANETYGKNPYQHYLDYGKTEGRVAYDASQPSYFDPNFYLQQNPDVAKAGVDPYQHYLQFGQMEGRAGYNTAAPAVQQQYTPTTTSWSAPTQQLSFNAPTVSQAGGEGSGGAVNYQYRRGGILGVPR